MPGSEIAGRGLHRGAREVSRSAVIFGCQGLMLSADEASFYRDVDPWGFILFARNIDTPDQVAALTDTLRATVGRNAPILIDQEGGRVQRLRAPHWREFPPAMQDAARPDAERVLELRYELIARELLPLGVDVNCAPLLDVPVEGAHDVIGERALARDPSAVARLGHAVRRGLAKGGVLPVIKHMPGHGRSTVDTHHDLPRVAETKDALERDFAPFREHADAFMGMSAHLIYEAIDPDAPGTLSAAVIDVVRSDIGFDGLLMTDDISMGALSGSVDERSARALSAGCDVVLHCNGELPDMQAAMRGIGSMNDTAALRASAVEEAPRRTLSRDTAALDEEYRHLTAERMHA